MTRRAKCKPRYEAGDRVQQRNLPRRRGRIVYIVGPDSMGPRCFKVAWDDGSEQLVDPRDVKRP